MHQYESEGQKGLAKLTKAKSSGGLQAQELLIDKWSSSGWDFFTWCSFWGCLGSAAERPVIGIQPWVTQGAPMLVERSFRAVSLIRGWGCLVMQNFHSRWGDSWVLWKGLGTHWPCSSRAMGQNAHHSTCSGLPGHLQPPGLGNRSLNPLLSAQVGEDTRGV